MSEDPTPPTIDSEDNVGKVIDEAVYQPSHIISDISTINGWDRDTILYVKKIGDLAGAYNWIHNNTAFWYSIIDYIFHFVVLVLAAPEFAGVLSMISESANTLYVKIIVASIVAVSFVISGMHVYFGFPNKISNRRSSATRYCTIFFKVRNELIKNDEDRREANEFIEEIEEEFKDCYTESPACWSITVRRYLIMMKGKTDLKYSELSGIQEIQIRRRKKKMPNRFQKNLPGGNSKSPRSPRSPRSPKSPRKSIWKRPWGSPKSPKSPVSQSNEGTEIEEEFTEPSDDLDTDKQQDHKNAASKMMNVLSADWFRMGKAQKQYQMDRHFIDIDV